MSKLFPESIKRVGLFPFSLGNQGEHFFSTALKRLDDWGVDYVCPEPRSPEYRYLAAPDEERARIFNTLLADESIGLLFAIRGGFGAARVLPLIDWELLLERNIPVVGFSDMSAFLLGAYGKGFKSGISGYMAESSFGDPRSTARQLAQGIKALRGAVEGKVISVPCKKRYTALKPGKVSAPVVPTNLMLLTSLMGTPWLPSLQGKILVIEGIGQDAISIDRALTQLVSAGILPELAGLVFGSFSNCDKKEYLPEIFREYSGIVDGPCFCGLQFGHEFPSTAIRVGSIAILSVAENGEVVFE